MMGIDDPRGVPPVEQEYDEQQHDRHAEGEDLPRISFLRMMQFSEDTQFHQNFVHHMNDPQYKVTAAQIDHNSAEQSKNNDDNDKSTRFVGLCDNMGYFKYVDLREKSYYLFQLFIAPHYVPVSASLSAQRYQPKEVNSGWLAFKFINNSKPRDERKYGEWRPPQGVEEFDEREIVFLQALSNKVFKAQFIPRRYSISVTSTMSYLSQSFEVYEIGEHASFVQCLDVTDDGKKVASATHDGDVKIWTYDGASVWSIKLPHPIHSVQFIDQVTLAVAGDDSYIKIFDVLSKTTQREVFVEGSCIRILDVMRPPRRRSHATATAKHGREGYFVCANEMGTTYFWELKNEFKSLDYFMNRNQENTITCVCVSHNEIDTLVATGHAVFQPDNANTHNNNNNNNTATSTPGGIVKVYKKFGFEFIREFRVPNPVLLCCFIFIDGINETLLVCCDYGEIFAWNIDEIQSPRRASATPPFSTGIEQGQSPQLPRWQSVADDEVQQQQQLKHQQGEQYQQEKTAEDDHDHFSRKYLERLSGTDEGLAASMNRVDIGGVDDSFYFDEVEEYAEEEQGSRQQQQQQQQFRGQRNENDEAAHYYEREENEEPQPRPNIFAERGRRNGPRRELEHEEEEEEVPRSLPMPHPHPQLGVPQIPLATTAQQQQQQRAQVPKIIDARAAARPSRKNPPLQLGTSTTTTTTAPTTSASFLPRHSPPPAITAALSSTASTAPSELQSTHRFARPSLNTSKAIKKQLDAKLAEKFDEKAVEEEARRLMQNKQEATTKLLDFAPDERKYEGLVPLLSIEEMERKNLIKKRTVKKQVSSKWLKDLETKPDIKEYFFPEILERQVEPFDDDDRFWCPAIPSPHTEYISYNNNNNNEYYNDNVTLPQPVSHYTDSRFISEHIHNGIVL